MVPDKIICEYHKMFQLTYVKHRFLLDFNEKYTCIEFFYDVSNIIFHTPLYVNLCENIKNNLTFKMELYNGTKSYPLNKFDYEKELLDLIDCCKFINNIDVDKVVYFLRSNKIQSYFKNDMQKILCNNVFNKSGL